MEYKKGFYESVTSRAIPTANIIAATLSQFIEVDCVVDVGSGDGAWIANFATYFKANKFIAIDLPGNDFKMIKNTSPKIELQETDFEIDPFPLKEESSLTIFVEVIEHISFTQSVKVLDNVLRNSTFLIFSGAVSGQGGTNHINEKPFGYWFALIEQSGFVRLDILRPILQNTEMKIPHYYKNNICLFYNPNKLAGSDLSVNWEGLLHIKQVSPNDLRSIQLKARQSILRHVPVKFVSKMAQFHNWIFSLKYN
jgi:hypothetical protein